MESKCSHIEEQNFHYLHTSSWRPATDGWFVVACCEAEEGDFPKPWPNTSTDDPKQYKGLVECQTHQYKTEQRCQDNSQHSNPVGQWEKEDWRGLKPEKAEIRRLFAPTMDNMTRKETAVLLMHLLLLCPTFPRGSRFWQIWLLDVGWAGDLIFLSAHTHCGSYSKQNIQHQLNWKSPYSLLWPPVVYLESAASLVPRPHFRAGEK